MAINFNNVRTASQPAVTTSGPLTASPFSGSIQSLTNLPSSPYAAADNPDDIVANSLEAMLNPNSRYIQNARQRGAEFAQQRGGINSSIAAGASERAALEAATPLAMKSVDIQQQREGVEAANWLSGMSFSRELQGELITAPMTSSLNMLQTLSDYALRDPELYTPSVMSGFTNFFNRSLGDSMSRYFGKTS